MLQKRPRTLARFLVTAVRIFMEGLAILVSLIIKLSPELTCHGVGRDLHVNP